LNLVQLGSELQNYQLLFLFSLVVLCLAFYLKRSFEKKPISSDWKEEIKEWSSSQVDRLLSQLEERGEYRLAGEIAYYLGRYQEAGEYYLKGNHYLGSAKSFLRLGKFKEAGEIFKRLGELRRAGELLERAGDLRSAGEVYLQLGDYERAGRVFEKIGDKKRAGEVYLKAGKYRRAGELFEQVGDYQSAGLAFQNALADLENRISSELASPELIFYQKLARRGAENFFKAGKLEEAIALCERARLYRESAGFLERAGRLKEASEHYQRAGEILESARCLELLGESQASARLRADYYLEQGDIDRAIQELEKAEDWLRVAELYRQRNELSSSAQALERAGEYNQAGELWEKQGEWLRAGEDYEKAGNYLKAGECYERAGESSQSCVMYEKGGDYYKAGWNLYQRGLLDQAIRFLQQVEKTHPQWRSASSLLGRIFQEKGMLNLARESLRQAVEGEQVSKNNLEDFYQLALLNERLGDFEQSMEIYERILLVDIDYKDVSTRLERLRQQKTVIDSRSTPSSSLETTQTLPKGVEISVEKPVRYEIIEEIGRGGMGIVYKARDTILDRIVAYKVLPSNLRDHPAALRNFFREAKSAARLNHPNIITVYDAGEEAGNYYIAMEYLEGETVKQILNREGKLPLKAVLLITGQVCRALEYAHERKVVHRDVKSSNIMWTKDKQVKLMDFGLAKVLEEVKGYQTIASGTPYYMSPEQALGKEIDHRTDIYSLGVTMFEMVTGQLPFRSGDAVYHHIHTPPPEAKSIVPDLDEELNQIILRCMQKDPNDRFPNARELLEALKKVKTN